MSESIMWLAAAFAAYWAYCLYWGAVGARLSHSASDYFLADRSLTPWISVLAVTGSAFSAWVFLGQPALIFRDGLQFAQLSLAAITIPLTGVLFFKRQWLLGKRFGYVTSGEMLADYFSSPLLRLLVVLIAVVFSVPFLGMQLRASGALMQVVTGGVVDGTVAMWVLAAVVFLYVCIGGLRAVAYVGTLQALLMAAGLVAIGLVVYTKVGGFGAFNVALAKLAAATTGPWGSTAQGYNSYFEIPGVIQFTAGLGKAAPVGGPWTASMILTYGFALMGILAAPQFSIWAFSSKSPKSFAPQQVWASAAVVGFILLLFAMAEGMGPHILHDNGVLTGVENAGAGGLAGGYIRMIGASAPWFGGLLAVSALAGVQIVTAAFFSTGGTILARDLYRPYLNPTADDRQQKLFGRIGVGLIALAALLTATFSPNVETQLGALALGFGAQLWLALAAICWFPWITREGVVLGLLVGLVVVVFTEPFGTALASFFGVNLPWGRWPWTIHSAGWGIFFNVAIGVLVSLVTQNPSARAHRQTFHTFLAEYAALPSAKRPLRPVAWAAVLVWLFFAIGPGVVLGNDVFGPPNGGIAAWTLGIPSLWGWQFLWWVLGVLMIWFLAYKMELSIFDRRGLEFYFPQDRRAVVAGAASINWQQWFWGAVLVGGGIAVLHWMFG